MNRHSSPMPVIAALAALLTAGCAHQAARKSGAAALPPSAAGAPALETQAEPSLRDAAMISVPELKLVHFDYNSDILDAQARATLAGNAAWLKQHKDIRVQVSGNCDQRGTTEYNLALGQRRAAAVRGYYVMMGVAGSRVATISYGKERPVCSESTEDCWRQNRRAETLAAVSQNVSSAAKLPGSR